MPNQLAKSMHEIAKQNRLAQRGPTHADRIRAMTDEELAAMIIDWQTHDPAVKWCRDERGCADLGENFVCTDELESACIVRWLRQPAEEVHDGQTI